MYLVMGITGNVGGATARHLLKQGKQVRALVRNREKAANWADQGVELVDGDWNDATAIAAALKGVEGAFVMLPAVWAPSPDLSQTPECMAASCHGTFCQEWSRLAKWRENRPIATGPIPSLSPVCNIKTDARDVQSEIEHRVRLRSGPTRMENRNVHCTAYDPTRRPQA